MSDPNLFAARALRQALADAGIAVTGTTRSTADSATLRGDARPASAGGDRLAPGARLDLPHPQHQSEPLRRDAAQAARQVASGVPAPGPRVSRVERRFLIDSVRIDSTEFALDDGSGLASANLITPSPLPSSCATSVRTRARRPSLGGLPRAGRRQAPQPIRPNAARGPGAGQGRNIGGVNTLSGYLERPDGRVLTFSGQANHHTQPTRAMLAQIDSLVVEMAKRGEVVARAGMGNR